MGTANGKNQDTSLLFCLGELRKLEEERIAGEAKARVEAERLEAERAARAQMEEEQRRRIVEAEAKLRVQADVAARDAEAAQRLAALRAELAAVQSEREVLRARFVEATLPVVAEDRRRAARGWGFAFGAASAVAAGLAALLVMQDPAPVALAPAPASRVEPPVARVVDAPVVESAPVVEPAPEPEPVAAVAQTKVRRPRPPRDTTRNNTREILSEIDECGDDPTCGIDVDETPRRLRPR